MSFALALSALILYPLAISLPVMSLQRFGHRHEASIWTGTVELLHEGDWLVGGVVFVCSVLLPLLKLMGLVVLGLPNRTGQAAHGNRWARLSQAGRARVYRLIEWTGRWGMLDVLLLALLVAWVKVGDLVEISAGPAVVAFAIVVTLSLMASATFDPHSVWDQEA